MTPADFLLNLNRAVNEFTSYVTTSESRSVADRRIKSIKMLNVAILYEIILVYFMNTGVSTDENIMTESELQLVISKLNNIIGSTLYVDL